MLACDCDVSLESLKEIIVCETAVGRGTAMTLQREGGIDLQFSKTQQTHGNMYVAL